MGFRPIFTSIKSVRHFPSAIYSIIIQNTNSQIVINLSLALKNKIRTLIMACITMSYGNKKP